MRPGWTVLTALLLTCTTAHADEVQEDGSTLFARAFPTITALCADHLAEAAARRPELETTAKENGIALAAATCRPSTRSLGVPFAGNAMYKRALFLEQSDGLETHLRLAVETPRGLVPTAIGWSTLDPLDPGCPGTPETSGLAALRIENGYLVAVLRQTIITFDESGKGQTKAIHGATWCGEEAGALRCRTYESQYEAPLGRFTITPGGELVRQD